MSAEVSDKKTPTNYKDMLIDAMSTLEYNKRKGISKVAIVNYIQDNYDMQSNNTNVNRYVGNALTGHLTSGRIERIKGSFRLISVKGKTNTSKKTTAPVDKENVNPSDETGKKSKPVDSSVSKTTTKTKDISKTKTSSKVDKDKDASKSSGNSTKDKAKALSDNDVSHELPKKTMKKTTSLTKLKAKPIQKKTVASIEKSLVKKSDSTDESASNNETKSKKANSKTKAKKPVKKV